MELFEATKLMNMRGIKVDLDAYRAAALDMQRNILECERVMRSYGLTTMGLKAIKAKFCELGKPVNDTKADTLKATNTALGGAIVMRRHWNSKLRKIEAIMDHADGGSLRDCFRANGQVSGRFTSGEFSVLNIPKDIRFFKAARGKKLVSFDFAQMEIAVAAYLSRDPEMIKAVEAGDTHQAVADMLGVTRDVAKQINIGIMYGMTEHFFVNNNLDPNLYRIVKNRFNVLFEFADELHRQCVEMGYVETIGGYRRSYESVAEKDYNIPGRVFATYIQGSAADIVKAKFSILSDSHYVVGILHDEFLIEVKDEAEVARIIEVLVDPISCVELKVIATQLYLRE